MHGLIKSEMVYFYKKNKNLPHLLKNHLEELKSNKTDQTDHEETVYNMASPSAFLNIESSSYNEEGHKNSKSHLMGANKGKIYDLENEAEVLFEEIKE